MMRTFLMGAFLLCCCVWAFADGGESQLEQKTEASKEEIDIESARTVVEIPEEEMSTARSLPAFQPGADSGGAGVEMLRQAPEGRMCRPANGCILFAHCDPFWCACVEEPGSICLQNYCFSNCEF